MTFKEWLSTEGVTSHAQVQMIPNMGNADWKRPDVSSKYHAKAQSFAPMPPAGAQKPNKPSHPPEFMDKDTTGYGFDKEDRKKAKPRSDLRPIDRNRKSVPMRVTQVYD